MKKAPATNLWKNIQSKCSYLFKWDIVALLLVDCSLLTLALFSAIWLRLGAHWDPKINQYLWIIWLLPVCNIPIFVQLGLYRAVIKFCDDTVVYIVFCGVSIAVICFSGIIYISHAVVLPRAALAIYWLFAVAYIGSSRFILRGLLRKNARSADIELIAIYGAGAAGVQLLSSLINSATQRVVCFLDDNQESWHNTIRGLKIYSIKHIQQIKHKINVVWLAIPSATILQRQTIIKILAQHRIPVKSVPDIASILCGKLPLSHIQNIELEELLGRSPIAALADLLGKNIIAKVVLVTGAGGSIGSELSRQIALLHPKLLILLDAAELALYHITQELKHSFPSLQLVSQLSNITQEHLMECLFSKYQVQTIYHAAAYKHVTLVEQNPIAAIYNNIIGTYTLARLAAHYHVETMLLISTDKAVNPTNIMGVTKKWSEDIMQLIAQQHTNTIFSCVRFGNVLGSSGSVVPLFKRQIAAGGPITITHPDVTRFFMTITEAVELVIQASSLAKGGEIFVLDMGEPVKILDLARQMVYLSGTQLVTVENACEHGIAVEYIGLAAGEKLHEQLFSETHTQPTIHPKISYINPKIDIVTLEHQLDKLLAAIALGDDITILAALKEVS